MGWTILFLWKRNKTDGNKNHHMVIAEQCFMEIDILGGGFTYIFFVHPLNLGRWCEMIQFNFRIFYKGVGSTTNQLNVGDVISYRPTVELGWWNPTFPPDGPFELNNLDAKKISTRGGCGYPFSRLFKALRWPENPRLFFFGNKFPQILAKRQKYLNPAISAWR